MNTGDNIQKTLQAMKDYSILPIQNATDSVFELRQEVDAQALQLQVLMLFMTEEISKLEYKRLVKMLFSPDKENHVVAYEIIKTKIQEL